jgi:hypothetical protein
MTIGNYGFHKGYEGDAAEALRWLEKVQQMDPQPLLSQIIGNKKA